jgi:hypothetical protein
VWLALIMGCIVTDAELFAALDRDGDAVLPPEAGGRDCDNDDRAVHPSRREVCGDGVDNDCDGVIDDDGRGAVLWYVDSDGDGWGDASNASISACSQPAGRSKDLGDCDDADPIRHPGLADGCNGLDDDCDLAIDEDAVFTVMFPDEDRDGAGAHDQGRAVCDAPAGWVENGSDCDDEDPAVTERVWYLDADGDGWGDPSLQSAGCESPPDFVSRPGDCADDDAEVSPDAPEICDNDIDDDCSGDARGCGLERWDISDNVVEDGVLDHGTVSLADLDLDGWPDAIIGGSSTGVLYGPLAHVVGPAIPLDAGIVAALPGESDGTPVMFLAQRAGHSDGFSDGVAVVMVELPLNLPLAPGDARWDLAIEQGQIVESRRPLSVDFGRLSVATLSGVALFTPTGGHAALGEETLLLTSEGNDFFGSRVVSVDARGDGVSDAVVSDPASDGKEFFGAAVVSIFPDVAGLTGVVLAEDADVRIDDPAAEAFGFGLEAADMNDDGHDDLIVRALRGGTTGGTVDILLGPFAADGSRSDRWATAGDGFPMGAGIGEHDVTHIDGVAHLVVGAPLFGGVLSTGRVYVIRPTSGELSIGDAVGVLSADEVVTMGGAVVVGDVNLDGLDDIVAAGSVLVPRNQTHIFLGASL